MDRSETRPAGLLALSCVGFIASAPGLAQTATAPAAGDGETQEFKGVTVDDTAIDGTGYKAEIVQTPKFTAPLIDTPRSIVVVGEQVIKQTGSATLVDALRTVPGITFGAAEGGNPIGDRPFIRGFDSQGSAYLDGVRDIGAQSREVFAVEQIQVVRGSDSSLGGRGSAGGTINIISKLPKADTFFNADGSAGNAAYKRATLDLNYALTPTIAVRVAAMGHDQDVAGRDAIFQKRWGVSPSIAFGLGTSTRLVAAYYHLHTNELPDSGLPYTYVCSATTCNAPAGNFVNSEPVNRVTTLGGQTGTVSRSTFYGLKDRDFPQIQHRPGDRPDRARHPARRDAARHLPLQPHLPGLHLPAARRFDGQRRRRLSRPTPRPTASLTSSTAAMSGAAPTPGSARPTAISTRRTSSPSSIPVR